ncbi:MAG: FHA domain-containing protein [bacterium]|jgi:hypothetical protein
MTRILSKIVSSWRRAKNRRRKSTLPTTIWLHLVAALEESGRAGEGRPNEYQVIVSAEDRGLLPRDIADLEKDLAIRLEREAHARKQQLQGPVRVVITTGLVDGIEVKPTIGSKREVAKTEQDTTLVFHLQRKRAATLPPRSLAVLSGPDEGATFALWGEKALLGRRETNHVVLHDDKVSRVHLAIAWSEGQEYIEDLGSLNGTWLNGRLLRGKELLRPGDKIVLGSTTLEYRG